MPSRLHGVAGPVSLSPVARGHEGGDRHGMYAFVRDRESSARTYANAVDRVISRGQGSRLFDTEGREYLDFLSAAGTLALGHNHPYVTAKVREFLDGGQIQQGLDLTTPAKYEFLQQLYAQLPRLFARRAKVQFCGPTGADAVEAALKLLKTATGRRTVLSFHGAYHGMTAGALALTGNRTAKEQVSGLMPDVHFLPFPYPYRCPFGLGGKDSSRVSLAYIERLLRDPENGIPTPAALLVEAVQGEGGVIPAPTDWLRGLRALTTELDIPLVIDEIQTGLGRTGTMFAFQAAGIEPDVLLLSKALGGGFPLSVVLYDEKYDAWQPGAHAGTFRGNQVAMIAGAATMEVIAAERLVDAAREKGAYLRSRLRDLARAHPEIGDVRGRGLMWGLEIVDPAAPPDALGSRPVDPARARAVKRRCLEYGLILESGGRFGAVLRLLPPLVVTRDELDEMLHALEASLAEVRPGKPADR
jgi:diaminobutyrate-2-oxoglutarate transaminase